MRTSFPFLLAVIALGAPSLVTAAPLDCPDAPAVFGEADAGAKALQTIADQIGTAGHNGGKIENSLSSIADALRKEYPKAGDADVADIMITGYCRWLATSEPGDQQSAQDVQDFEQRVYQAVFAGPPPSEYKRQGWLYGN